jgi:hypothetical protein
VSLPKWLYHKREGDFDVIWRLGSRRPLRLVLTILQTKPMAEGYVMPTSVMLGVGAVGIQWGPVEGLLAGQQGMPPGSRGWVRELNRGLGIGVSLDGSAPDAA